MDAWIPQDLEAETALLGSVLIDWDQMAIVRHVVSSRDFYREAHRLIWAACERLYDAGREADLVTLPGELDPVGEGRMQDTPAWGGLAYLGSLASAVPTSIHAEAYALQVASVARSRAALHAGNAFQAAITRGEDAEVAYTHLQHAMASLAAPESDLEDLGETVERWKVRVLTSMTSGQVPGIPLPWPSITAEIVGFMPNELYYCQARPATGKSAWLQQCALHAMRAGLHALYVSMEMSAEQLLERFLALEQQWNTRRYRQHFVYDGHADREAYAAASATAESLVAQIGPYYHARTKPTTMDLLRSLALRLKDAGKLDCIYVDYLSLITGDPRKVRLERIGDTSRLLRMLASEADVPVVALHQMSRASTHREDQRPILTDLRDSGDLEQDANGVFYLFNDENTHPNAVDFGILKNRGGPDGFVQPLHFRRETMLMEEWDAYKHGQVHA